MKNYALLITIVLALMLTVVSKPADALDVSIGGSVVYNWCNPSWNNGKIVQYSPEMYKIVDRRFPRYSPIMFFLYGPDIKIKFLRSWEISTAFRYGQVTTQSGNFAFIPSPVYRKLQNDIKVYDIYASLGYYILDYLNVFFGLRAEIFNTNTNYKHVELLLPNLFVTTLKEKLLHFTPELGITVSVPLSELFACIFIISGTFQSGSEKSDFQKAYDRNGPQPSFTRIPTGRYYALGGNASCAFKISIPKINTSFSLGAYYRILRYFQKISDRGFFVLDGSYDQNLGAICSVSHTFSFGGEKKQQVWIPRPNYD